MVDHYFPPPPPLTHHHRTFRVITLPVLRLHVPFSKYFCFFLFPFPCRFVFYFPFLEIKSKNKRYCTSFVFFFLFCAGGMCVCACIDVWFFFPPSKWRVAVSDINPKTIWYFSLLINILRPEDRRKLEVWPSQSLILSHIKHPALTYCLKQVQNTDRSLQQSGQASAGSFR